MQIPVPPDLGTMKDTVLLGLTKKQLAFFIAGAVIGIPVFFLTLKPLGSSNAALIMLLCMFPFFFFGIYQKNGYTADVILVRKIRHLRTNKIRLYENISEKKDKQYKRRKEVKRLEREVGKGFTFQLCKFIYETRKVARKGAGKIGQLIDKRDY